ncbi:hypothetical protein QFZ37_003977 [Chryseobacterium ginsenosidimutans]|uniref:hypothetical protein n=1 Tax=Chryseobacterium ginsenosidimutans TaxID=687846 RepID=UPI0027894B51|nr:hypothetical protein [Chryseobacterium ginsenosidimutans]MDQ0595608.1 hypothetical protein [Chryseobacterium ginsenosidimutans]
MKKSIYTFIISTFACITVNSQNKVDNPLLLHTWKLNKIDLITYTFKKNGFDKKFIGFKFKKNGKIIGNVAQLSCPVGGFKVKLERITGVWKKVNDTMITIEFPYFTAISGGNIVEKVNENELVIRRNFRLNKK